jgi:site-specific DNA-methyltransferase (adenine-specific)
MSIEIYNEDCLVGLKKLPTSSVKAIVTSPPYNISAPYHSYKDNLDTSTYLTFLNEVTNECHRVLTENGCLFWNISAKPSNQELQFDVINLLRSDFITGARKFHIQNTIHWIKSIYTNDKTYGHVKPINSDKYLNPCHEFIIQAVKSPIKLDKLAVGVPYTDKSNINRWKSRADIKDRGNAWFLPYKTVNSEKNHPASFPIQLPINCLKLLGLCEGDIVVDPFLGSGTTALACKELGIKFIGFELDEYYYSICKGLFM